MKIVKNLKNKLIFVIGNLCDMMVFAHLNENHV